MSPQSSRNPVRLIAPAALILFAIVLVLVLSTSGLGGGERETGKSPAAAPRTEPTTTERPSSEPPQKAVYVVEPGDTLGAIAAETDVPVETLQELNPELDPQTLVSGQEIKLREEGSVEP